MGDSKSFEDLRKLEMEGDEQLIEQFPSDDSNPILRVEKDGTIVYANRAAFPLLEHWGVREKERIPQALRHRVLRVLAQKSPEYLELTAGKRVYSAKLSPLPEEGCVNIYGFDVSKRAEAEEKPGLHQEKLEKLVEIGTREYVNANEKLTEEIAERKKIGKVLQNNLQFLETLLNTIPAPVFYKDEEGRYMGCNEIFASQILGLPQEKILGKTLISLPLSIPEELTEYCHKVALELIRTGGNQDQEVELVCADGKKRSFLVSRAAFKDEEGEIAGMVGVMQDITQRKSAEEALRNTVSFLEALIDGIPSPVFQRSKNGIYLNCNETFASQIMGLPKEKVIGGPFEEFQKRIPEELAEIYQLHDQELLKQGGSHYCEMKVVCEDGVKRDFLLHKATYKDSSGNVSGIAGIMLDITQRKAAEEIFRKCEERYRIVAEQTGQLVYDYDISTGEIDWAGAIKELTGYSPEEFRQVALEGWRDHIHPEDVERAWEIHEKCMKIGEKYLAEYRFRRKDGSYFHVEDSSVYLRNEKGQMNRIIGVIKNISEKKVSREILEKSEERFRAVAERTGQLVYDYDLRTNRSTWEGAIEKLTKYSYEEFQKFVPEVWAEHLHPEDRQRAVEIYKKCLATGEDFHKEYRLRRKDGSYFYAEDNGFYIKDKDGKVYRTAGVIKDISERKLAAEKLEKSEEKYRTAAEQTGQIVFEQDLKSGVIDWAGAIRELTGYSAEEFREFDIEKWEKHVHPEDSKRAVERITEALVKGEKFAEEYRFRRKDGDYFYVESCGIGMLDEDGKPFRALGVMKDITERKLAAEKLERSEERYRLIAEHTGQVLYHDDYMKGKIEWAGAIPEITGYGFEEFQEITANGWLGLIHPEDRKKVIEAHDRCRKNGGNFFEEYRLKRADGSYVTVEDEGVYLKDENGNISKALGVIKDIEEKKLARKKLLESEERFRVAAEQTGQIVFEHDHINDVLTWSGAITEITGYSIEKFREFDGKAWAEHVHPEDRERVLTELKKSQEKDSRFRVEYRFRKKDGSYFHVEDSGVYLRNEEGQIRKAVGVIKDITPIKLAAEKLRKSEERFRIAAEKTGQLVYDFDISSEKIMWAGAIEDISGYTHEEIHKLTTGKLWKEHIHPEDYKKVVAYFANTLKIGGSYCQEYRFKRKSGNYIYVEDCGIYLRDNEGRVYRMIGVIKNITERKQGMEELRRSEEKFRIVAEQTGQLVYDYDIPGDKIGWGGAIQELMDYGDEEFKKLSRLEDWKELLHPEDRKRAVVSYKRCLEKGEKYHEEYRLKRKDGTYLYVENRGVFLKDENGHIYRMLGANKDITQLKNSLEKVRESEEKYRSFIQNFKGIAFQGNMDFTALFMHGSLEEITGYREEDFYPGGLRWDQIIHPKDLPAVLEDADKLRMVPGASTEREYRIRKKDGNICWVHEIVQNISDKSGKPVIVQGSIYDVTERKEAEEALARTEEIRKKEIHHRIKNNLQVISSLLELQAEKFKDREVIEAFRESQNRVASMAIIHEELYRAGDTETLDFSAYLRKLTSDLLSSYAVRKEDVKLKLEADEVFLGMDTAIPLGIIINELVSNALKHAFPTGRKGEIQIKLCRKEISENKSTCKITSNNDRRSLINNNYLYLLVVSDNGLGFPENIDFKKTDSLGLQLVNILVEQLEGTIEMEKNRGTTFRISFTETG
jgi:PAS domain S-box-containing protein